MAKVEKEKEAVLDMVEAPIKCEGGQLTNTATFCALSMQELLNLREGNEILLAFYDNEMKTYATEFGVNDEERYKGAVKQVQKYLKVREYLFNEIKKRIDVIYEKDLA